MRWNAYLVHVCYKAELPNNNNCYDTRDGIVKSQPFQKPTDQATHQQTDTRIHRKVNIKEGYLKRKLRTDLDPSCILAWSCSHRWWSSPRPLPPLLPRCSRKSPSPEKVNNILYLKCKLHLSLNHPLTDSLTLTLKWHLFRTIVDPISRPPCF